MNLDSGNVRLRTLPARIVASWPYAETECLWCRNLLCPAMKTAADIIESGRVDPDNLFTREQAFKYVLHFFILAFARHGATGMKVFWKHNDVIQDDIVQVTD